jgi:Zn-dependent peptidase ImmA (M78 family)
MTLQLRKLLPSTLSDYWEERANKVLSHFQINYPDEIDMYEICRRYGIKIKPLDPNFYDGDISNDLKGLSIATEGRRGLIYIKSELDPIEKKLILAEEFCHIYAHYLNELNLNTVQLNKTEGQAKRMSAYLTMPQRFLDEVYTFSEEHAVLLSEIADYFLVTEGFVQYRLELIFNRKIDGFGSVKGKLGTIEWYD